LRDCEIANSESDAGKRLQAAIKAFYLARNDRRIKVKGAAFDSRSV
jgi:hypothetical protein